MTTPPHIPLGTLLDEALWRWPTDPLAEQALLRALVQVARAALPPGGTEAAQAWVAEVSTLSSRTDTERAISLARGMRLIVAGELCSPKAASNTPRRARPAKTAATGARGTRQPSRRPHPALPQADEKSRSLSQGGHPPGGPPIADQPLLPPSPALTSLKGCGPRTVERLASRGIRELQDLLDFLPVGYEDRRQVAPLTEAQPGQSVLCRGQVVSQGYRGRTGRRFYEIHLTDGEGSLVCLWFRTWPGLAVCAPQGARVLVSGLIREYQGALQMVHPTLKVLDDGEEGMAAGVVPRYPPVEGVAKAILRKLMVQVVSQAETLCPEPLPSPLRGRLHLPARPEAYRQLHLPRKDLTDAELEALLERRSDAHRRLIFDALFLSQLALAHRRQQVEALPALRCPAEPLPPGLFPFTLTPAQARVIGEITQDLTRGTPMQRLIQGDVGSGKTAVAFAAAAQVMAAGGQVAFMAPTEILAAQHHATLTPWMQRIGRRLALLTASTPRGVRESTLALLAAGHLPLVVGTHALLAERVTFAELSLVIVDEQHRFGVAERARLRDKGTGDLESPGAMEPTCPSAPTGGETHPSPHLLVMTATPIPRTLALTVYGDLDLSVLDGLPPGRVSPITHVFPASKRHQVYTRVMAHLDKGRRAFVVCPLVEESEALHLADAEGTFADLTGRLAPHPVGLLHGRLPSDQKAAALEAFRAGRLSVLVATTVVEVGVDVPEAEIMVVESAQRFGLAQLHQLRGRVGRRAGAEGLCLLLSDGDASAEARRRLQIMAETADGFRIAEEDLRIRGPGEILGLRQAGGSDLGLTGAAAHPRLFAEAREAAREILRSDPDLRSPEHTVARQLLGARFTGRLYGEETG